MYSLGADLDVGIELPITTSSVGKGVRKMIIPYSEIKEITNGCYIDDGKKY